MRGRANRKRANEVPAFSAPSTNKINLDEYEEVEDEYGFRYMRKKQRVNTSNNYYSATIESTPTNRSASITLTAPLTLNAASHGNNYAATPSTPTPSKQVLENNRRKRRSSFAVMAAQNQAARTSSIGISLSKILPPENVKTNEFHKHLQPDMPGPVKMRQLLIWAVQKASQTLNRSASPLNSVADLSEDLVQALLKNELTTSWYQRPPIGADASAATFYLPNPQNQELSECIDLYTNYQQKLAQECQTWEQLRADGNGSNPIVEYENIQMNPANAAIDSSLNALFAAECAQMSQWLHGLPLSIDRLDWHTKLAINFGDHSKQFCESVFHQIFAKFFAGDLQPKKQRAEPMLVLRALSAKNE